ncbi:hypothetical protein GCK72_014438 [Caenorhabditis remanei]|uniref:Uncharacterized protein n=1 Tax=Caenorhabditis remanei TaxID=31234 RepID=A0A6A5GRF5_CAERE|nr:hypothetical protein GCK72_014438 [Caenorhabditis remanei]KAF1757980.1 hypothetical protein GCK72_014438 [Caenorhabditis remanei]
MGDGPDNTPHFSMFVAQRAFLDANFEEALKHFFVCIKMLPVERRGLYEEQFAASIHGWITTDHDNAGRAVRLYPQIRELFPLTIPTKLAIIRAVQTTEQEKWLLNCLPICKDAMELATKPEELVALRIARVNLTTVPFPQWHIRMINDVARNEAYAKALSVSIKSRSSVVFDIGSGTGLLSVMAAKQTNLVIALEENICLAMLSKEVLKRNGVEGRVSVECVNSTQFKTCQKADVIVSEIMDCCVFGERIIETFIDAHIRFAHQKTIFIPNQATVYVRLFKCREIFDIHCQDYGGVRYRSEYVKINDSTNEQPYWCTSPLDYSDFEFLSDPEEIHSADFTTLVELQKSINCSGSLTVLPIKKGVAHGFAIHFTSDLTGKGDILNSAESRSWELGIIPFKEPCLVDCGQELDISWKLAYNRLDLYNNFYDEGLQKNEENLRYETASLEQLQKLRDDSYFKAMMSEIDEIDTAYTIDTSSSIPAQCMIETAVPQIPPRVLITSLNRYDGSLDQDAFFQIERYLGYRDNIKKIVPTRVRIFGRLFYSDRINSQARIDPTAHCQVDLATVRSFHLREMRDIRLSQRKDIVMNSDEFLIFDFDMNPERFKQDDYTTMNREIEVQPKGRISDGVIYEFEILGSRNTKLRPVAAFLFPERVYTQEEMTIMVDLHVGDMLISLKDL